MKLKVTLITIFLTFVLLFRFPGNALSVDQLCSDEPIINNCIQQMDNGLFVKALKYFDDENIPDCLDPTSSSQRAKIYERCWGLVDNELYQPNLDASCGVASDGTTCKIAAQVIARNIFPTFVDKLRAYYESKGISPPLTPTPLPTLSISATPTPTPGDFNNESFKEIIDKSANGCGIAGTSCCIPGSVNTNLDIPLPGADMGFVKTFLDYLKSWITYPQEEFTNDLYSATDGRLCSGLYEPRVKRGSEVIEVKNRYTINPDDNTGKFEKVDGNDLDYVKGMACTCEELPEDPDSVGAGTAANTPEEICALLGGLEAGQCKACNSQDMMWDQTNKKCLLKKDANTIIWNSFPITEICKDSENVQSCIQCLAANKEWTENIGCGSVAVSTKNMSALCSGLKNDVDKKEYDKCKECMGQSKMWTALGCIDLDTEKFIQNQVFGIGIGLAGLTALLCIIYSAIKLQLSQNNPDKIKEAQELMTACITGLIIIIFSVFILRVIGVDLLKIPGFS